MGSSVRLKSRAAVIVAMVRDTRLIGSVSVRASHRLANAASTNAHSAIVPNATSALRVAARAAASIDASM